MLVLAASLAGCSTVENFLSGDRVDYRTGATKTRPLDVPPDLSQLARDPRYAPQAGVISASSTPTTPALQGQPTTTVAPAVAGRVRVEKQGSQRWLVVEASADTLYGDIKAFWEERGFKLTTDDARAGVMETDWVENRAKLPNDLIRSTLGRLVDRLYDTGERDRFRTRLERNGNSTEIFITHRGLQEVYSGERKESTVWVPRDSDPQLESQLMAQLVARLSARDETSAKAVVAAAVDAPARARALPAAGSMEVDEPFDRAWRRVSLALDRSGFTIEDRDRSAGLFFVRYVDPKAATVEEPGFFAKLFGAKGPDKTPQRYRVVLKGDGGKTAVTVQNSAGTAPEVGDAGKAIVAQLVRELR
ncbi:MAG: outer membrane protein assembly factor BamC [Rubrivivax sp.]|nr:outer membrane protein assembly factor BamC [Rubrivivax sp.]